ncbi:MAG: glycogen synthase GlgA [Thiocapsa sp.]|nr:glycogen synthase GlgA [Thiocapsa sp.]MCG6986384.1 glycogen synthase GlgA [Thiocapsa sp.]
MAKKPTGSRKDVARGRSGAKRAGSAPPASSRSRKSQAREPSVSTAIVLPQAGGADGAPAPDQSGERVTAAPLPPADPRRPAARSSASQAALKAERVRSGFEQDTGLPGVETAEPGIPPDSAPLSAGWTPPLTEAIPQSAESDASATLRSARSRLGSEEPPEAEASPTPEPLPPPAAFRPNLFVVHITPELAAVAKVGGLADVVFGLSRELAIRGNHVEIILPKYSTLRYDQVFEMQEVYRDLWVPWYDGAIHCTVFFGFVHGRKCFFIEPHSQDDFFNRSSIYGFRDDVLRYAFFSRAAMEFLWKAGKHPDVIHVHDWQTALVPVFLYELYQPLGMTHPRVCLTIHNFAHQGVTGIDVLHATGLRRPERFFEQSRMADNHHPRALNLLKAGIVYSNFVTTVSPRYAFETKDQGQGFGLEPTLHVHHLKYGGVVNGIDYDVWNPEIDHHIPVRYGVENIDGKYENKRALRHRLMLADNEKPIVAFIGRLDPQKGLELVRHAIFYTLEQGAQFVLLGSSPNDQINADFWGLKTMLNDSPDCHLEIGFDEELSHLIYAGADLMLVPSRFEPCGLTQLIALRYGTIPVVREVGGLADTVFDKDHSHRPLHERNGYVFRDFDNAGLESALGRAIACYRYHPDHFRELMKNAMRCDYSWNVPGQDYLNIYDYIREG